MNGKIFAQNVSTIDYCMLFLSKYFFSRILWWFLDIFNTQIQRENNSEFT